MFSIALCEDNLNESEIVLSLLKKFQTIHPDIDIQTQSFCSGAALLDSVKTAQAYDLFLLDIVMPGITGISLARWLREEKPGIPVVFLTNSMDYAFSAYKVSAVQYILKPIVEKELFDALDQVIAAQQVKKEEYFVFPTSERTLKIAYSSIVYVEINGHVIKLYLENGEILSSKSLKVPFLTAVAPLRKDRRFLHAHKSYLINMEHVQELCGRIFIMTGGHTIPFPNTEWPKPEKVIFDTCHIAASAT